MSRLLKMFASRKRSFAHMHWFRTAETCPRCRKIEHTVARYSVMNDALAVIACAALGCGCRDPRCLTVVKAVLLADDALPRAAGSQQDGDLGDSGRRTSE